jgi:hypothetical protein
VPAAAVIPAPAAYTNIAAVETFVVGLWGLVCRAAGWSPRAPVRSGRPPRSALRRGRGAAGTQPPAVTVQVPPSDGLDQPLCEVPFGGDRTGSCTARMLGRSRGCGPLAPHTTTPVRHRGQPSLYTVENPVCPKQPELAECSSMACRRTDWMRATRKGGSRREICCAGLAAHRRQHGAVPRTASTPWPDRPLNYLNQSYS